MPDRRRSTTGARCRASRPTRVEEQLGWDELPAELTPEQLGRGRRATATQQCAEPQPRAAPAARRAGERSSAAPTYGATLPPWSAAHAYTNLYGPKAAQKSITATVTGNVRVTEVGREYDTHHIVLDFGAMPFPVLEGQSIGIVPPGHGRQRPAAPSAPVLDRQPAQRRAARATTTCR